MSTSSQGRSSVKNTYPQNLTWQPLDRSMLWNKAWNPIRTLLFIALSLPHLCLPQKKGTSSYSLWQALTLRATQIFPSQEPHATPTLKPLANTPWANLPPGKSVIMPYTSPPIKTISQTTFYISRETITRALTIQALDRPACSVENGGEQKTWTTDLECKLQMETPPVSIMHPSHNENSTASPQPSAFRYLHRQMAKACDVEHEIHITTLHLTFLRPYHPQTTCRL